MFFLDLLLHALDPEQPSGRREVGSAHDPLPGRISGLEKTRVFLTPLGRAIVFFKFKFIILILRQKLTLFKNTFFSNIVFVFKNKYIYFILINEPF